MRHYEIVVLLRSDRPGQVLAASERYKKMVTDSGGVLHRFEDWGRRPLAYPIKKQLQAHYFLFNVECAQPVLDELKEHLRFSETVIRFLIVRRDTAIVDSSPIVKEVETRSATPGSDDNQVLNSVTSNMNN